LIRSYDHSETWEVARAATAAPLFFEELKTSTQGVDGRKTFSGAGFGTTNNPTLVALQELQSLYGKDSVGTIVSVGTALRREAGSRGILHRIKEVFEAANEPKIVAAEMARKNLESYWRFEDTDGLDVALDEWRPNGITTRNSQIGKETMKKITNAFNSWVVRAETDRLIRECANELVARRRSRTADRERWKIFATGVRPEDDSNGE
jgi:hypothetical protein